MAINNYILTITSKGSNARFTVSYRSGKFLRLERKSGKLHTKQRNKLMMIIPTYEADVKQINKQYQGRVEYISVYKDNSKTLYVKFMEEYFHFYEQKTDISPRINAVDGKSLKSIMAYLQKISADDAEAFGVWKTLLSNWYKMEEFYVRQIELKQINSNLNTILRQIKNGKSSKKGANNIADEIRRKYETRSN